MKGTIPRLILPLALLCAIVGCGLHGAGSAGVIRCRITALDPAVAKAFFETGEYVFDTPRVSVMSGRKGGLYIMAEKPLTGGDRLQATIQLLNGNVFEAVRRGNAFQCRLPRTPCTLTDRDFGASDAPLRGLRHFPYITLQRYIRRDTATFSGKSVCFDRFTIHINECRIEGNRLYLHARFEGSVAEKNKAMHGAGFGIEGEVHIAGLVPGIMMTD